MCNVSALAPARSQAYAVSSSQFVPGARRINTRGGTAMCLALRFEGSGRGKVRFHRAIREVPLEQVGLIDLCDEIGRDLEARRRALRAVIGRRSSPKLDH